jgi:hypothetical protein
MSQITTVERGRARPFGGSAPEPLDEVAPVLDVAAEDLARGDDAAVPVELVAARPPHLESRTQLVDEALCLVELLRAHPFERLVSEALAHRPGSLRGAVEPILLGALLGLVAVRRDSNALGARLSVGRLGPFAESLLRTAPLGRRLAPVRNPYRVDRELVEVPEAAEHLVIDCDLVPAPHEQRQPTGAHLLAVPDVDEREGSGVVDRASRIGLDPGGPNGSREEQRVPEEGRTGEGRGVPGCRCERERRCHRSDDSSCGVPVQAAPSLV